jgi:hypothetical protein
MEALECAGSNACRQYCEALRSQGVAVEIGEAGCNVPAMFTFEQDGIVFDPKPAEEAVENTELVEQLGGALCNVLVDHLRDNPEERPVQTLIEGYKFVFNTRLNLWKSMLQATRDERRFTDTELAFHEAKTAQGAELIAEHASTCSQESVLRAQAAADHDTLIRHKLLFDDQMVSTVDRLVGNLMDSKPTLLVGDKGIAKTQAAKFVAELWDPGHEPVIISGHGDMMSNELIGQMEQDKDTRVFAFKEGKLVKAMREGRPVIIDEVNVGDQPVVMRLQDILLRRPGDHIMIQENGGDSIEIQPGFVVFATANEASARYQHRNVLDPAFRDRYDVVNLRYPDSDSRNPAQDVPRSLMRLALAAAVDEQGNLSRHIDAASLERLVRLSHVTEHLYSVPARNARVSNFNTNTGQSTSNFLDEEPVMTDCITPRALVDTVQRSATGNKPGMSLESEMERVIIGLDQAGSTTNQSHARRALTLLQR